MTTATPAPASPARTRRESAAAARDGRNDLRFLAVLEQNGETPQAAIASAAEIPNGSVADTAKRLEATGQIIKRVVAAEAGDGSRVVWRLTSQPEKETYSPGGRNNHRTTWHARRQRQDEDAAARGERTLRVRTMDAFEDAGEKGLTMAHAAASIDGPERIDEKEKTVRQLWQEGALARRRDGSFVIASTKSWYVDDQTGLEQVA